MRHEKRMQVSMNRSEVGSLSRREFLKRSALTTAGAVVGGNFPACLAAERKIQNVTVSSDSDDGKMPGAFEKAFTIPTQTKDQHDNPVVRRKGNRFDPQTGWPYEIWLKKPRMEFVLIPAGEFVMGSAMTPQEVAQKYRGDADLYKNEHPQHRVRITKPFYLAKYEITQGQWQRVMGTSPWSRRDYVQQNSRHSAAYISWEDCQEFLRKLGEGLRLPTEAEWEYAARAGSTSAFCFGDDRGRLEDYAWHYDNALGAGEKYAHPVGGKRPNAWGLYDMHGNVWEWCSDWYDSEYYGSSPGRDPKGPERGSGRVARSGSFKAGARLCRSAARFGFPPGTQAFSIGVRLARSLP